MTGGIGGAPITGDGRRTRSRAPARSDGDAAAPAHLPGHRARRPSGGRDRRSLVVRLAAVAVLVPVLGGAVVIDAARDEPAGPAAARPAPPMPAAPGDGERSSTWYCAAGTATGGGMADHSVTIVNPGNRDLAASLTVVAGAMAPASAPGDPAGGAPGATATTAPDGPLPAPRTERVDVPAGGRVDVRLGDRVEAPLAAAVVEVGAGDAVVEHRVRGEHGEDVAPCSTFAADTWHFAWGATTRDARDVVVLFNPFPSAATVDAAFTSEEGRRRPVRLQGVPVPGRSVVGIDLGEDVTRSEQVSATVRTRSGRVVAERLQQYDGSLGLRGLALDLGAPAPGPVWVFADGEASAPTPRPPAPAMQDGGSEAVEGDLRTTERIVVYNPGDERAEVDVQPVPAAPARAPLPFRVSVGPGAYQVVDYGEHDRIDPGVRHSTVVRSTNGRPVVVERVTADLGPVPSAGDVGGGDPPARPAVLTAAAGARLAAPRWVLPSVVTPGGESTVTYVVVNPGGAPVDARVDLLAGPGPGRPGGAAEPLAPAVVPPGTRTEVPLDADRAAAALASVVTADSAVVVEYLVRAADGRRVSAGPGVPVTAGAVPIDEAAGDGPLGGSPPG